MASWHTPAHRCISCGAIIAQCLAKLGSIRCHDCRKVIA